MKRDFELLRTEVIGPGLCTHCGTCAGSCPVAAIEMGDIYGQCTPILKGCCQECGLCSDVCPGRSIPEGLVVAQNADTMHQPLLGQFSAIHVGHALDASLRRGGASGGMVTAILLQLLETDRIDGAVALGFSEERPAIPETNVYRDASGIIRAAQSKYCVYPQNISLRLIREATADRIAYVGLPCQIHGIRKAEKWNVAGTEKIEFCIGLYCGNNLYYGATQSLFDRFGFDDLGSIVRVAYRDGEHPGEFVVEDNRGRAGRVDKYTFNYLSFLYTPFRCHFCMDQTNELADVSVGDAWRGVFSEEDRRGRSVVISRKPVMRDLIEEGQRCGRYTVDAVTPKDAIRMHANVLDNKKNGAPIRMAIWRGMGKEAPEQSDPVDIVSIGRQFIEAVNLVVILVCATRLARGAAGRIPLSILRPLLRFIRGIWRKWAAARHERAR